MFSRNKYIYIHYSRSPWAKKIGQETVITFGGGTRFWRSLRRWKAGVLSFPTAQRTSKTGTTTKSYARFFFEPSRPITPTRVVCTKRVATSARRVRVRFGRSFPEGTPYGPPCPCCLLPCPYCPYCLLPSLPMLVVQSSWYVVPHFSRFQKKETRLDPKPC